MMQRFGHYDGMSKNRLKAFDMWVWRRMERVKWTDEINKCSYARKSGKKKNDAGTGKEEE